MRTKKEKKSYTTLLFVLLTMLGINLSLASDKFITIASSEGPPHIIDGPSHGIDLDITEVVLNEMGYEVSFTFMSLARAIKEVKAGRVDAVTPTFNQENENRFFVSKPFINYKPMIFTLKESGKSPKRLADLSGESIVTFQGAPGYFGPEFVKLSRSSNYHEIFDMKLIPEMIMRKSVTFAVLDQYIFYYFYRINDKKRPIEIFNQYALIKPVKASVAFKNKTLRDKFDKQLEITLKSNIQQEIVERYLGDYGLE